MYSDIKFNDSNDIGLLDLFNQHVTASPDAIALVYHQQRLSYAELNGQANRFAYWLAHYITSISLIRMVSPC